MDNIGTIVIAVIALFVVIRIIKSVTSNIKPMSKKESIQYEISKKAAGSDGERAFGLGKSARDASKKGGCLGWLLFIVIIGVVVLWLLSEM